MSIDFGVQFWFRCVEHGRFSLQDAYPEKPYEDLLDVARKVKKASCPKCGKDCAPCPCSGESANKSTPDRVIEPRILPSAGIHTLDSGCPKCMIGAVCLYCGKDLRV